MIESVIMSQAIIFLQHDDAAIEESIQKSIKSLNNNLTTEPLAKLIHSCLNDQNDLDKQELREKLEQYCTDLVVYRSKQYYSESVKILYPFMDFWLQVSTGKGMDEHNGDFESIEQEIWHKIFSEPLNVEEIENHTEWPKLGTIISATDTLNIYLSIKKVFEFSRLTNTEMWVFHEDASLSPRWKGIFDKLYEEVLPLIPDIIAAKKDREAEELKPPPFSTAVLSEKEFYTPQLYTMLNGKRVKIVYQDKKTDELHDEVWSSKVMPGQTYEESIRNELKSILKYTGNFKVEKWKKLIETQKDKSDNPINKYEVKIFLLDPVDFSTEVFGYKLNSNSNYIKY